ncbi:DUF222 domain-containing protein [Georgenia sp. SYP-B2076]|uniref:HNH endonuclease n=1 Tax=Georgenia sp. SYP-B2076 TaxID=2495881 RepID=UPI000F8C4B13|nr:DUF222 domain-containing protein [Georgenia sp. SYP-B2076]
MFDGQRGRDRGAGHPGPTPARPTSVDIARWRVAVADLDRDVPDAERVDQLRALEELKAAASAAQARIAVDLDASQRRAQAAAGVPAARRGQGVGAQVALARRESPARGGRLLGLAKALVLEMPHTFAALAAGSISEWRATLLVRESACLSVADRAALDAELWADPQGLERMGDRRLVARARAVAYRLDAAAVVRRARKAEGERGVSLRPAPDTMTYLTGLLPVAQGVGVYAALTRAADALRAQGDGRSRGQLMADTLVERVTGQARAADVPVEVQVVMTERTLLTGDDEPAAIPGYGTVPAEWARELVKERTGTPKGTGTPGPGEARVLLWLRRLFTAPGTGQLVAMDSRRRIVPPGLARFVGVRDQLCRTLWCDAAIRHRDHVVAHAEGGATTAENLQGTCEGCNYAKAAPGWRARILPAADQRAGPGGHVVETTTPTGHRYASHAPALPGHTRPAPRAASLLPRETGSGVERALADYPWTA